MPSLSDRLIKRAMETPYDHLKGYMNRYWLVPYKAHLGTGTGPVSFWRRPFAWLLQRFDIAIRVHQILRSDDARAFHDHPWPYITVILKGGYVELMPQWDKSGLYLGALSRWRPAGSVLFRPARSFHRLQIVETLDRQQPSPMHAGCWTLFITFGYRQTWGFMPNPAGKIPYKEYLRNTTDKE